MLGFKCFNGFLHSPFPIASLGLNCSKVPLDLFYQSLLSYLVDRAIQQINQPEPNGSSVPFTVPSAILGWWPRNHDSEAGG